MNLSSIAGFARQASAWVAMVLTLTHAVTWPHDVAPEVVAVSGALLVVEHVLQYFGTSTVSTETMTQIAKRAVLDHAFTTEPLGHGQAYNRTTRDTPYVGAPTPQRSDEHTPPQPGEKLLRHADPDSVRLLTDALQRARNRARAGVPIDGEAVS